MKRDERIEGIKEMSEVLAPYASSIIGLMVTGIIMLLLGPIVAAKKAAAGITPGSEPDKGYDDGIYRIHRAHMNAVENYAQFAIPALFAMLLGVSAVWVCWLVWLTVAARLAYTAVYLMNIGKPAQSIRTFVYVGAWAVNVVMVVLVVMALM